MLQKDPSARREGWSPLGGGNGVGRVGPRTEGWERGRGDRDAVIVPDFMEVRNALSGCFPGAAGEGEARRGGG